MSTHLIGLSSLFLAALLYGSQNIATRVTGLAFGAFLATSLRNLVVVASLSWITSWKPISRSDWKWFALRAFGNVIATTSIFIAVNSMPVGIALFTFYAAMMASSTILGMVFYKEKITGIKVITIFITLFGLALVNMESISGNLSLIYSIPIIGGLGVSLWTIFSRPISTKYSLPQLVVADNLLSGILALSISLILGEPWKAVQLDVRLLGILYLGFTQVFTGQLVAKGFQYIDAQIGTIILLNDTIIGILLAFLLYQESVSGKVIIGGLCIFLASIIPAVYDQCLKMKSQKAVALVEKG